MQYRKHTRAPQHRGPETIGDTLDVLDHEPQGVTPEPRWLARARRPITEGATRHPLGKILS